MLLREKAAGRRREGGPSRGFWPREGGAAVGEKEGPTAEQSQAAAAAGCGGKEGAESWRPRGSRVPGTQRRPSGPEQGSATAPLGGRRAWGRHVLWPGSLPGTQAPAGRGRAWRAASGGGGGSGSAGRGTTGWLARGVRPARRSSGRCRWSRGEAGSWRGIWLSCWTCTVGRQGASVSRAGPASAGPLRAALGAPSQCAERSVHPEGPEFEGPHAQDPKATHRPPSPFRVPAKGCEQSAAPGQAGRVPGRVGWSTRTRSSRAVGHAALSPPGRTAPQLRGPQAEGTLQPLSGGTGSSQVPDSGTGEWGRGGPHISLPSSNLRPQGFAQCTRVCGTCARVCGGAHVCP